MGSFAPYMVLVVGFSGSPVSAFGALQVSLCFGVPAVSASTQNPCTPPRVMEWVRGCRARAMPCGLQCQSRTLTTGTLSSGKRDPQSRQQPDLVRDVPAQGVQPGPAELLSDFRFPHRQRKGPLSTGSDKGFLCLVPLCVPLPSPLSIHGFNRDSA